MSNKINNTSRDSKSKLLNLSSSTSMQSLESKAARAALVAQTERTLRKGVGNTANVQRPKRSECTLTELEREIKSIRSALERVHLSYTEVSFSRPTSGSSAVCVITTSEKEMGKGAKRTYVFYPSVTDPSRLGSVAVYGSDVERECDFILRRGSLFGLKIGSVSVEMGRRPFLDVTFRA